MHLIYVILIGFLIGVVAKMFVATPKPTGFVVTTCLGIAGAWVGGIIFGMLGFGGVGFIGSVIGAIIVLVIYRSMQKA